MHIEITTPALKDLDELRRYFQNHSLSGLNNIISDIESVIRDIPVSVSRGRKTPRDDVSAKRWRDAVVEVEQYRKAEHSIRSVRLRINVDAGYLPLCYDTSSIYVVIFNDSLTSLSEKRSYIEV